MLAKIFLTVLLLNCVCTYTLKSIKDNNNTNFQKLPDNFSSKINGTQTVNPNLKIFNQETFQEMMKLTFGEHFQNILEKYGIDFEDQIRLFNKTSLERLHKCKDADEIQNVWTFQILPRLEHTKYDFKVRDQVNFKTDIYEEQEKLVVEQHSTFKENLTKFIDSL